MRKYWLITGNFKSALPPRIGWFSMEDWRGGGYKYIVIISPWLLSPTAVHAARVYLDVKSADQALHGTHIFPPK